MSRDTGVTATGSLGRLSWLVFLSLVLHVLEEWSRFPEWATRHFGTTSPRFYAVSHVPILAVVAWVSWRTSRPRVPDRFLWLFVLILVALSTNTLFHVGTTALFGEYSPGLITAVALYLPLGAYLLPRTARVIGPRNTTTASIAGFVTSALAASSLALDMPTL